MGDHFFSIEPTRRSQYLLCRGVNAHCIFVFESKLKGAWIHPPCVYLLEDPNMVSVHKIPPLLPTSENPVNHSEVTKTIIWKHESKDSYELAVLASWKPLAFRKVLLAGLIHWGPEGSGLCVLNYTNPFDPQVAHSWANNSSSSEFGIHSAAIQTIDFDGIAVRSGRRFLSRIQRQGSHLEFRSLAYAPTLDKHIAITIFM